jgi:hypothetical protein
MPARTCNVVADGTAVGGRAMRHPAPVTVTADMRTAVHGRRLPRVLYSSKATAVPRWLYEELLIEYPNE